MVHALTAPVTRTPAPLILFLGFLGDAPAQPAPKWNEDRLTWTAPTQCADGSPRSACSLTGYRIERAASTTATTWNTVGLTGPAVTTFLVGGLAPGRHCYRVIALAARNSGPSNVACKMTVAPPPPSPPLLEAIDTVT
jgi:hypothetical protein